MPFSVTKPFFCAATANEVITTFSVSATAELAVELSALFEAVEVFVTVVSEFVLADAELVLSVISNSLAVLSLAVLATEDWLLALSATD